MNQPDKKQFFNYMSNKFGYDFRCEQSYQLLKDVVREADEEEDLKQFVELKDLNKRDSEIYRNYLAEKGMKKHRRKYGSILQPLSMVWNLFLKTKERVRRISFKEHCHFPLQGNITGLFLKQPRVLHAIWTGFLS